MFLPAALKLLSPKLIVKIIDYVTKDNELDLQMKATIKEVFKLKKDIKKLRRDSHPEREFVVCNCCKKTIESNKGGD